MGSLCSSLIRVSTILQSIADPSQAVVGRGIETVEGGGVVCEAVLGDVGIPSLEKPGPISLAEGTVVGGLVLSPVHGTAEVESLWSKLGVLILRRGLGQSVGGGSHSVHVLRV